ncbi:MAG: helix-turn-helix transcriptional regulator, partial [Firmicutes bacterium]|nr:helix-turn-helix transcriptional regulator [Bacillota bacterium]
GMGHYLEMSQHYHSLNEQEILASPSLMQAMSMLCSLETDYEASEKWYGRLRERALTEKSRELRSRVAWLDICLPQRSVTELIPMIPKLFDLVSAKDIEFDPMAVTGNLPSVMNGGKDYSAWSGQDKLLAQTIGHALESVLGKEGVGLIDCAVAESRFEKGEDISSRIIRLLGRLQEIQRRGTPDMEFAVVGLAARTQIAAGRARDAWELIDNLRTRYEEAGLTRFLPNMDAMLCRIALQKDDRDHVARWYREKAPKDPVRVWVTRRYEYITEAMALLSMGENEKAMMSLSPLLDYFDRCSRHIDSIKSHLLLAIAGYRLGNDLWQSDLNKALCEAAEFGFTRTVSELGAAILPLLEKSDFSEDKEFLKAALLAAREQTAMFPRFLEPQVRLQTPLTQAELQVLRMICADKSNQQIADALGTKLPTVKTQVHCIFEKLNVKRRSEAKTAAQTLKLF